MSDKHTPGSWYVGDSRMIFSDDAPHTIARAYAIRGTHKNDSERDANARLIAAAPDLLEALTRLTRELEIDDFIEKAGYDCWINLARKAIAKATNEE